MPLEQPGNPVGQHLDGSNNSGGFDGPVQQEIMEVEIIGEWKAHPEPVSSFQQAPAANTPQEPLQVWKSPEQPEAEAASSTEAKVEESEKEEGEDGRC